MAKEEKHDEESCNLLDDNPCWGTPTAHSLSDLLSQLSKERAILYESDQYVVLNKPPDFRMDGPYPATVHKLLTYWYPPPSLQDQPTDVLACTVSKLHRHNHLADNALRHVHQLDYATSGVLCVARTQEAAAHASRQWEDRQVHKMYLAVLEGNLLEQQPLTSLPRLEVHQMEATLKALELRYRQSRRKPRKDTLDGFLPAHALFHKWKNQKQQQLQQQQQQQQQPANKKKRKLNNLLSQEDWENIFQQVNQQVSIADVQKLDWKQVSKTRLDWKRLFQAAADKHNDLLRKAKTNAASNERHKKETLANSFPTVFGCPADDKVLYVYCPLAQTPTDFAMKVPSATAADAASWFPNEEKITINNPAIRVDKDQDESELDFKPSLTKCRIVTTAKFGGTVVTKVELWPLTGRRHQLRVHMALLGHAILGDVTYNRSMLTDAACRMCLHAKSLSLNLLSTKETDKKESPWSITTPDPFEVEQGVLRLGTMI